MQTIEYNCCGCDVCYNCGRKNPYLTVTCDKCSDKAKYNINNKDYCILCTHYLLNDIFSMSPLSEQKEILENYQLGYSKLYEIEDKLSYLYLFDDLDIEIKLNLLDADYEIYLD